MAELSLRYAASLFDLSLESGTLDQCLAQAATVRDVLQTGECRSIMEHPHISGIEKRSFLSAVTGNGNDLLNRFLHLLIAKHRETVMISALDEFIRLGNSYYGITEASVVSAFALDEQRIAALKDLLSRKLGKQVDISLRVDPTLIGGFFFCVDGFYVDCSVKSQLNRMKKSVTVQGGVG